MYWFLTTIELQLSTKVVLKVFLRLLLMPMFVMGVNHEKACH
jgi:hypothetical protein